MGTPIHREPEPLPCRDPNLHNPPCEDCGGPQVWQALEHDPEDFAWDCPACIEAIRRGFHCAECEKEGQG